MHISWCIYGLLWRSCPTYYLHFSQQLFEPLFVFCSYTSENLQSVASSDTYLDEAVVTQRNVAFVKVQFTSTTVQVQNIDPRGVKKLTGCKVTIKMSGRTHMFRLGNPCNYFIFQRCTVLFKQDISFSCLIRCFPSVLSCVKLKIRSTRNV